MLITFLSDFGLRDTFVGVCHGVMRRIAPGVEIVDLTHGIEPRAVVAGAVALADALPYVPPAVHLAVVDPGVGGDRRGLVVQDGRGGLHVGPDNGLLLPSIERLGGIAAARELVNPQFRLQPVSRTFHGRDVFTPAAAHLARGVALEELGPALEPSSLVRLELPEPSTDGSTIRATALAVDRFGNVRLNVTPERVRGAAMVRVAVGERSATATVAGTFADVKTGTLLLLEDSSGSLALAVNGGEAAERLGARVGDEVLIEPVIG